MRLSATLYLVLLAALAARAEDRPAEPFRLRLRSQHETAAASGRFHTRFEDVAWSPTETAVIVCDMWDTHTCPRAAERVAQMAPRLNDFLIEARRRGALIIHAPSGTMDFYAEHPGRRLAQAAPAVEPPVPLERWCRLDPDHEPPLPIDDTDGGCDGPRVWQPGDPVPWTRQIASLEIDPGDAITDSAEAYFLLRQRQIRHVIITGVHTNMCVLGRPFGIRQLVRQGLQVALARDLTDTMYNPDRAPGVSHFTGTDLVIDHIERYWCPTIISGDLLDGKEFRFPEDRRRQVVFLQGEAEYHTAETLPHFAREALGSSCRTSFVWFADDATGFPGCERVADADLLFVSVRRHPLPADQLTRIRGHVAAGKPVIGIRTASHAFHLRNTAPPAGLADWPEFDREVFGGHYTNHLKADVSVSVRPVLSAIAHPLLADMPSGAFPAAGSLYLVSPLAAATVPLLEGHTPDGSHTEPVAWIYTRQDGGRSFYTSLGHADDFARPEINRLLTNAVHWLLEHPAAQHGE
jgi:nicotinamidase-related amidase/type 1 glutamine amidotransferase